MSLSAALLTGFTGIQSNQVTVDTVGDNLANLNTTAFKGQRALFETLLYDTVTEGEAPTAQSGGTLPRQFGNGSGVAVVQRSFAQGGIEQTGFARDLAIDGRGMFVLSDPLVEQAYTRDGAFTLDGTGRLVSQGGRALLVYPADAEGNVSQEALSELVIPVGSTSEPVATANVQLDGALNGAGAVATTGAVLRSRVLDTASGAAAGETTSLADLVDSAGVALFSDGDEVLFTPRKGGLTFPDATFVVGTDGTTLRDFADFLQDELAIDVDPSLAPPAGITVEDGAFVVRSNIGGANAVELDASSIRNVTQPEATPFAFTVETPAEGESVTTSFDVFDSLGNPVEIRLRYALESRADGSTTWRFFAESLDDADGAPLLGSGTVTFDSSGRFLAESGTNLSVDRSGSGAATPLALTLDMSSLTSHRVGEGVSTVLMESQDGVPSGEWVGYVVEPDGRIIGKYTNERDRVLGQLALATFINEEGLLALEGSAFVEGPNSGEANLSAPRDAGAGGVVQGALEQSNVEIAREFINLITASTGISSASRVVRTADELLQQLLLVAR
jgi:flagellar hook protein FlgE